MRLLAHRARPRPATGAHWCARSSRLALASVRALVRRLAIAAGLDPAEFGAKSLGIGGATDWRDCLGDASAHLVKQRGRWQSDVAEIYQRPLLASQLAASMWVRPGGSADLEFLCAGFSQATR